MQPTRRGENSPLLQLCVIIGAAVATLCACPSVASPAPPLHLLAQVLHSDAPETVKKQLLNPIDSSTPLHTHIKGHESATTPAFKELLYSASDMFQYMTKHAMTWDREVKFTRNGNHVPPTTQQKKAPVSVEMARQKLREGYSLSFLRVEKYHLHARDLQFQIEQVFALNCKSSATLVPPNQPIAMKPQVLSTATIIIQIEGAMTVDVYAPVDRKNLYPSPLAEESLERDKSGAVVVDTLVQANTHTKTTILLKADEVLFLPKGVILQTSTQEDFSFYSAVTMSTDEVTYQQSVLVALNAMKYFNDISEEVADELSQIMEDQLDAMVQLRLPVLTEYNINMDLVNHDDVKPVWDGVVDRIFEHYEKNADSTSTGGHARAAEVAAAHKQLKTEKYFLHGLTFIQRVACMSRTQQLPDLSSVFALDTITLSTHVQRRPGVLLCALGPLVQGTEYLVKTFVINQKPRAHLEDWKEPFVVRALPFNRPFPVSSLLDLSYTPADTVIDITYTPPPGEVIRSQKFSNAQTPVSSPAEAVEIVRKYISLGLLEIVDPRSSTSSHNMSHDEL